MWGHPEVYILVPARLWHVLRDRLHVFQQKRIFGYTSMVCAAIAITLHLLHGLLHHFFTMGSGANVNSFFSIVTMFIAIPAGVQVFDWILTMYNGS